MKITPRQRAAMALIVLFGLLAMAAVLFADRTDGEATGHAHEAAHAHDDHDGDEHGHPHADEQRRAQAPAAEAKAAHDSDAAREVKLTAEQVKAAGITVQQAGPAQLRVAASFPGEVRFNDDRTAHVVPRLAGVADAVPAQLGQPVQQGQVLAVIASSALAELRSELLTARKRRDAARVTHDREKKLWEGGISAQQDHLQALDAWQEAELAVDAATQKLAAIGTNAASGRSASPLNRLELRAPFAGTVVEKHLSVGEAVKEDANVFTVADLTTVWAEFAVAPKDLATVRVGQRAVVSSTAFEGRAEGTVSYVGALLGEQTRTARARITLANPLGAWRPGLFVTVSVLADAQTLPLTVGADAVQSLDGQPTVFKAVPGGFAATPVKVGRTDGHVVEVLEGLNAGDAVAATSTFTLKSELGKASAEHAH